MPLFLDLCLTEVAHCKYRMIWFEPKAQCLLFLIANDTHTHAHTHTDRGTDSGKSCKNEGVVLSPPQAASCQGRGGGGGGGGGGEGGCSIVRRLFGQIVGENNPQSRNP